MRIWACIRAHIGGYFWKRCPVCARPFGGHEIGGSFISDGRTHATCRRCPHAYARIEGVMMYATAFNFGDEPPTLGWVDR